MQPAFSMPFSHGLAVLRPVKRMQNPWLPAFAALAVKPRLQAWELDGKIAMAAMAKFWHVSSLLM